MAANYIQLSMAFHTRSTAIVENFKILASLNLETQIYASFSYNLLEKEPFVFDSYNNSLLSD